MDVTLGPSSTAISATKLIHFSVDSDSTCEPVPLVAGQPFHELSVHEEGFWNLSVNFKASALI